MRVCGDSKLFDTRVNRVLRVFNDIRGCLRVMECVETLVKSGNHSVLFVNFHGIKERYCLRKLEVKEESRRNF